MHGTFHFDTFLIFLLLGFILSLGTKFLVHRLQRWMKHVNYMRKLAGGTLIVDAEANYWLGQINDPTYMPQWRWSKGEEWKKYFGKGAPAEGKRSRARKIGYINIILVVIILLAFIAPYLSGAFGGLSVGTTTKITPSYLGNLTYQGHTDDAGYAFNLSGTDVYGRYPGGRAGLQMSIERTDDAYATRDILLNLTSGTFSDNGTLARYVTNVTWLIEDPDRYGEFTVYFLEREGVETFFGLPIKLPQNRVLTITVFIGFRDFDTFLPDIYVELTATGSDKGSRVYIYGGYVYGGTFR